MRRNFLSCCLLLFLIGSNSLPTAFQPRIARQPLVQPVETELRLDDSEEMEERDDWFYDQRTYPFTEIPVNLRRQAFEQMRRERAERNLLTVEPTAAETWRLIGPTPTYSAFPLNWGKTSGRINAIAVSPADSQLILIGAATGGIFRSTDGGFTFAPASDNQADLAVGSIAFSKSNPQIAYAGMGDYKQGYLGSGVLRSTNAGQTWARVSNSTLPAPGSVSKIAVDLSDPNRVYLAQYLRLDTDNRRFASGFYYSTDGGVNWTKTLTCLPKDLVLDVSNPRTLYLGVATRSNETETAAPGLYRSTDAGLTWTRTYVSPYTTLTTDLRVAVTPAVQQTLYVYTGGFIGSTFSIRLEVSTDGGATWVNRGTPNIDSAQFGYNTYLYADPVNANTLYIGSRDVFKSIDGGVSWTNQTKNFFFNNNIWDYNPEGSNSHSDQHAFTFAPDGTIYIGNDGGFFKSSDSAGTFRDMNSSLSLSMFVSIALHPTDRTLTYGGTQDNGTQRRLSGSSLWQEFATGDGGRVVINPQDPRIVFTTYIRGTIYRFSQDTSNYDQQVAFNSTFNESNTNTRIAFYPPFTSNGVDSTLYFATWRLFMSTNLGSTWNSPAPNMDLTKGARSLPNNVDDVVTAIGVNGEANRNVIYTGSTGGRAMVSTDGGASWKDITAGLPNRSITGILVDPADSATAYLTVSGFGTSHIFKTTNLGATWTNISSNLPDVPVSALLIDPLNASTLLAGSDIGIFRSTNNGASWEPFNDGLPPVIVTAFSAQKSGLIQAATYGRGIYELNRDISSGVPVISLAEFQTSKLLVISGSGFGSTPTIFINDVEQTDKIKKSNDSTIRLKAKAKLLGIKAGDNTIKVVSANSTASNVFTLHY